MTLAGIIIEVNSNRTTYFHFMIKSHLKLYVMILLRHHFPPLKTVDYNFLSLPISCVSENKLVKNGVRIKAIWV